MESTGSILGVHPDISVYAKVLTGGLVPLAVTLASSSIFEAFLSDKKADALLHGHSYTAHPIGCEVANETFSLIDKLSLSDDWMSAQNSWANPDGSKGKVWSLWSPDFITAISKLPQVKETMTLGSVLSIKVQDNFGGKYPGFSSFILLVCISVYPRLSTCRIYVSLSASCHAIPKHMFSNRLRFNGSTRWCTLWGPFQNFGRCGIFHDKPEYNLQCN
jgi:dethiobiotin synthetase/adenosylmethionine--8-amino-7-oxononanoate aminotransferase